MKKWGEGKAEGESAPSYRRTSLCPVLGVLLPSDFIVGLGALMVNTRLFRRFDYLLFQFGR
jgi:hypothetical protein